MYRRDYGVYTGHNNYSCCIIALCSQCTSEKSYSSSIISRTTLCAGLKEGGADACQNDSGGPLACKNAEGLWTLHGVVNRGVGCGSPHKYGIYARVTRFVRWINSVIS